MRVLHINLCQKFLFLHQQNPQYNKRFFIELIVQYMKIPRSNLGRTCSVQKLFLTFKTILVHNMFSPCSAKRRASDKDLPIIKDFYCKLCSLQFDKGIVFDMHQSIVHGIAIKIKEEPVNSENKSDWPNICFSCNDVIF